MILTNNVRYAPHTWCVLQCVVYYVQCIDNVLRIPGNNKHELK